MTQNYQAVSIDGAVEAPATSLPKMKGLWNSLLTNNAGATEPSTTWPHMWWADEGTGILKQRDQADSAWINRGLLDEPWSSAPVVGPSNIATGNRITLRRIDTAQVNVKSDELVLKNSAGFTRIATNVNVSGSVIAGATANSWRNVWVTANADLSTVGVTGRDLTDPEPTNAWRALVSCLRINGAGQINPVNQIGRNIYYAGGRALSATAQQTADLLIPLGNFVPPGAEAVHYKVELTRTGSGSVMSASLKPSAGSNANVRAYKLGDDAGATQDIILQDSMDLVEEAAMYFTRAIGDFTFNVDVTGYAY